MAETFAWDLMAASSLLLGGLFVLGLPIRTPVPKAMTRPSACCLIP